MCNCNIDKTHSVMAPRYKFKANDLIESGRIDSEAFDRFKSWSREDNLPTFSEEQLALFLLFCDNVLEDAQKTLKSYILCKTRAPELHLNWKLNDKDVAKAARVCTISLIPRRTEQNEVIFFGRLRDTYYWNFDLQAVAKLVMMMIEFSIFEKPSDGIIAFIDMKGAGLLHATRLRLGVARHILQYLQEALPCKINQVHVLNTAGFIDKMLVILRPFIRRELFDAVKFHSGDVNLCQIASNVTEDCVPGDYGGNLAELPVLAEETYKELSHLEPLFLELEEQARGFREM